MKYELGARVAEGADDIAFWDVIVHCARPPFKESPWDSFDLNHELTDKGIRKFVADYKSTLAPAARCRRVPGATNCQSHRLDISGSLTFGFGQTGRNEQKSGHK